MHTLTIIRLQGTFVKLKNADSSQLPASEKLEVNSTSLFDVLHYVEEERNHY